MPEMNINPIDENAIIKEVWSNNNIEVKTQLNHKQIESVSKLKLLAMIMDSEVLATHLTNFMELQKSLDRKSMGEFVDALGRKKDTDMNKNHLNFNALG